MYGWETSPVPKVVTSIYDFRISEGKTGDLSTWDLGETHETTDVLFLIFKSKIKTTQD